MPEKPSKAPAASTANIVKRDGVYHLYMLVDGRWLETGITSRKFLEITKVADREFKIVQVNAPLDGPPPVPATAAAVKDDAREGASEKATVSEKTTAS